MQETEQPRRCIYVDLEGFLKNDGDEQIDNISAAKVRALQKNGEDVIINTTCKEDMKERVSTLLAKGKVPYDTIKFDSALPTLYITPFYVTTGNTVDGPDPKNAFVEPRPFNKLSVQGTTVTKTSKLRSIIGELYFYFHTPPDVAHLFPKLCPSRGYAEANLPSYSALSSGSDHETWESSSSTSEKSERAATYTNLTCADFIRKAREGLSSTKSICMELVEGPTFSHLLTNRCLTHKRLHTLLESLRQLHKSPGASRACKCSSGAVNIYDNYSRKVRARLEKYRSTYTALGTILTEEYWTRLDGLLRAYEGEMRGLHVRVVHGDPVLTNCLSLRDGGVKFIDMRGMYGMEGSVCVSMEGDAVYDLAKCWQSLSGYDYISRDRPLLPGDVKILHSLQREFRKFVELYYPAVFYRDIVLIAASLYASMIPLHDDAEHRTRFASRSVALTGSVCESMRKHEKDFPSGIVLPPEF